MSVRHRVWFVIGVLVLSSVAAAQEDMRVEAHHKHDASSLHTLPYPAHPLQSPSALPGQYWSEQAAVIDPTLTYSLQRALDSVWAAQGVEGVSAAVLVPGQGIWRGVAGISSQYPLACLDTSMLFGIGSNTKAFVSATILSLVDDGMISLDDSLSHYLPAYPNITGWVTIRQLLNMTSGLFDYLNDSNKQGDSVEANPTRYWTPEEIIRTFVGPPKAIPGGSYSYCNTNYVLLGMVISSVTGTPVSSQIRGRIFTPLVLNHTFLEVEESYTDPVAHPWDSGDDFASIPVTAHFSTLWTAGGIMSTAGDMARWVKGLYEGEVFSQASLGEMLACVPMSSNPVPGLSWTGYGLGIRRGRYYGKEILGHTGMVMGYVSITGYLPQTGASFVALFNASEASSSQALTALLDVYLRNVKPQPAVPGVCYAISGASDDLRLYSTNSSTAALTLVGPTQYGQLIGARVHPHTGVFWGLANAGGWELVQIDGETGQSYPHRRVTFPSGAPSDFKGLAFSPEGTLFVGSVDGRIYTIDTTTGAATLTASTGLSISGLAFDPTTGTLWASIRTSPVLRDRIYTISLPSGDTLSAGNTGFNQPLADLAFDPEGNLFGMIGNPSSSLKYRLARIDKATGVGTEIGPLGLTGMVGIAFSPATGPTGVAVQQPAASPDGFALEQNWPNPFNSRTTIGIRQQAVGNRWVKLTVYDMLGREVAVLVDEEKAPGRYQVQFDASDLSTGVYVYRLSVGSLVETRKMLLLR